MTMLSRFSLRTMLVSTAAVMMTATALPSLADSLDAPLSASVNYSDLNLANTAGIAQLYGRIRVAANKVCQPFSHRAPFAAQAMDACVDTAMTKAITDVHQPALTAMYVEKSGKAQSTRLAQLN
jgi:UrcA family protein